MFNSISSKEEPVRAFGVSTRTAARHVGGGNQAHPFYTFHPVTEMTYNQTKTEQA
jgi:hypothetical protein